MGAGAKTVFHFHSYDDAYLAKGLVQLLFDAGWNVYMDWQAAAMPDAPNQETAQPIKLRFIDVKYFLFLGTPKSTASRRFPCEIDYADEKKQLDRILTVPKAKGLQTHGNEFQLHHRVDFPDKNELALWQPVQNTNGAFVKNL